MTKKSTFNLGGIKITVEVDEQPKATNVVRSTRFDAPVRCDEPDGIFVQVDRPRRECYAYTLNGTRKFNSDMDKFHNLERAAKACDWPNRGPIECTTPSRPTACRCQTKPSRELRWVDGLVPIGSVVVDHTWDGEPIFKVR